MTDRSVGRKPLSAGRRLLAVTVLCLAIPASLPRQLDAQFIDFRFVGIDMLGGAAWAADSDVGVSFGGRLGFADLVDRTLRLGFELDWWSAERTHADLAVRDALGGLALWFDIARGDVLRPFLGAGASLHWIDVSPSGAILPPGGELGKEYELEGARLGASGFAGVALRLSRTGTIWLAAEYRYTSIADVPYHEARLGFRLSGRDP
jgi:hypothetical protein